RPFSPSSIALMDIMRLLQTARGTILMNKTAARQRRGFLNAAGTDRVAAARGFKALFLARCLAPAKPGELGRVLCRAGGRLLKRWSGSSEESKCCRETPSRSPTLPR